MLATMGLWVEVGQHLVVQWQHLADRVNQAGSNHLTCHMYSHMHVLYNHQLT